ncbi:MAG: cell division protein FtsQ/DivIB, partial [Acidobacteriota bacterium]
MVRGREEEYQHSEGYYLRRPGKRPLRKSRKKRVRRAMKVFLCLMILGGMLYLGRTGYQYATHAPRFNISSIVITGNHFASEKSIRDIIDNLRGKNIFSVKLCDIQRVAESHPWLSHSTIKRLLPSTISVVVYEEKPVAMINYREQTYLISERAKFIDQYGPPYQHLSLPLISGRRNLSISQWKRGIMDSVRFINLLARKEPDLLSEITLIEISESPSLQVRFTGCPVPIKLLADDFLDNWKKLSFVMADLTGRYENIEYIDLKFA